jgi:hypothetical protein
VLADVNEGYVSPKAAERDYGVVLRREGGSWAIDQAATDKCRTKMMADKARA